MPQVIKVSAKFKTRPRPSGGDGVSAALLRTVKNRVFPQCLHSCRL